VIGLRDCERSLTVPRRPGPFGGFFAMGVVRLGFYNGLLEQPQ
jgi:hypothetical protein